MPKMLSCAVLARTWLHSARPQGHLIDVFIETEPNVALRVATYNIKKDTLTFYRVATQTEYATALTSQWAELWQTIQERIKGNK